MPWSSTLAERYLDLLAADAAADSGEVARLRRATREDMAHPALLRAFVRGACGFDPAHDADEQTLFYAVCLGEADAFDGLVKAREALDRDWTCDRAEAAQGWSEAMGTFWGRSDIPELQRIAESGLGSMEVA